jgi:hypothetical protein
MSKEILSYLKWGRKSDQTCFRITLLALTNLSTASSHKTEDIKKFHKQLAKLTAKSQRDIMDSYLANKDKVLHRIKFEAHLEFFELIR